MGCSSSSAKQATAPDASCALPTRSESIASRVMGKSRSVLAAAQSSSRSVLSYKLSAGTFSRKLSRKSLGQLSQKSSGSKSPASQTPKDHLPVLLPTVGPPLSNFESVFHKDNFKCRQCGNLGLNRDGRFCKACPYGGKKPPADLVKGMVMKDYCRVSCEADGTPKQPPIKIGIRGHYAFAVSGLHQTPPQMAERTGQLQSYASVGDDLEDVLKTINNEAGCSQLQDLIDFLPDALKEVASMTEMDVLGQQVEVVNAVVYRCVDVDVDGKAFLNWLDTAGYKMMANPRDWGLGLLEGVSLQAGIRHDRRALRISFFRDGVCVDAMVQTSSFM